jgi:hypothetical protein
MPTHEPNALLKLNIKSLHKRKNLSSFEPLFLKFLYQKYYITWLPQIFLNDKDNFDSSILVFAIILECTVKPVYNS